MTLERPENSRSRLNKLLQAAFISGSVIVGHGCDNPEKDFSEVGDKRPIAVLTELTEKTKVTGDNFETAYLSYCSPDLQVCRTLRKKGRQFNVKMDSLYREQDRTSGYYNPKIVVEYHNHPANIKLGAEIAGRDTIPKPESLLTGPSGFIDCTPSEHSQQFEFILHGSKFVSVIREPGGVWLCRPNYEMLKIPGFTKHMITHLNKELNGWRIRLIEASQFETQENIKSTVEGFVKVAPEKFGIEVQFLSNDDADNDFEAKLLSFANREPLFAPITWSEK